MRAVAALLLLFGCASQSQPTLVVDLLGPQPKVTPLLLSETLTEGWHPIKVRVTNLSDDSVRIETIWLESFHKEKRFAHGDQTFNVTVEPGQKKDFQMGMDVQYVPNGVSLDPVTVTMKCHTSTGKSFQYRDDSLVSWE